jgi:wyosine [tRNA(Phe)-imidazoG37] synthetase (radical SAM superfamily)
MPIGMPFSKDISCLHFGLTSKCTLSCPECVRTMSNPTINTLWRDIKEQRQIDWHQYRGVIKDLSYRSILFCGNWGDPIYYPDLIEFIAYIKTVTDVPIYIHTNGSYKDADFWRQLGTVLQPLDQILFSIDGLLEDDQYRVNNDARSRQLGVQTLVSMPPKTRPLVVQKLLVFSYNENNILKIIDQSRQLGFDVIRVEYPIVEENPHLEPSYRGTHFEVLFTKKAGHRE